MKCQICGDEFSIGGGLHRHLIKHNMSQEDYSKKIIALNNGYNYYVVWDTNNLAEKKKSLKRILAGDNNNG